MWLPFFELISTSSTKAFEFFNETGKIKHPTVIPAFSFKRQLELSLCQERPQTMAGITQHKQLQLNYCNVEKQSTEKTSIKALEKSGCTTCLFRMIHIRKAFRMLHEWHRSIQLKWKKNLMTQPMIKLLWVKPGWWIARQLLCGNCLGHIPTRMNCI